MFAVFGCVVSLGWLSESFVRSGGHPGGGMGSGLMRLANKTTSPGVFLFDGVEGN